MPNPFISGKSHKNGSPAKHKPNKKASDMYIQSVPEFDRKFNQTDCASLCLKCAFARFCKDILTKLQVCDILYYRDAI